MPGTPKSEQVGKDSAPVTPASESTHSPTSNQAPDAPQASADNTPDRPPEFGGQKGLEPTRYGDWEKNGRCTDF